MKNETTRNRPAWLSDRDLALRYSVSRITIWRWARAGRLPKPRKLAANTSRWNADEIEAHDQRVIEGAA